MMEMSAQKDRGADVVESKKKTNRRRCRREATSERQVKTATVENVKTDVHIEALETELLQPRTSCSSSSEAQKSISKATVVDSVTESTGVDQTLTQAVDTKSVDKAPMDLQRMRGTRSDVVCFVESPSRVRVLSDFELLYFRLGADSAVPAGNLTDFMKLEEHAHRAASRALNKYM